jgi:hypothetical protein
VSTSDSAYVCGGSSLTPNTKQLGNIVMIKLNKDYTGSIMVSPEGILLEHGTGMRWRTVGNEG